MPKEGDLKVWWIPQVPMKAFEYSVKTVEEACILCDCLAKYDLFQYENNVKPDYSNAGGLIVFDDGEWVDWYDVNGISEFDEYMADFFDKRKMGKNK